MSLIQSFNELGSFFTDVYNKFISAIESSVEGLELARDTINEFDTRIVTAVDTGFQSEFGSLPVADAIGLIRYLVGDPIFYLIYLVILIGCLFTIYKLIVLLYEVIMRIKDMFKTGYIGAAFTGFKLK